MHGLRNLTARARRETGSVRDRSSLGADPRDLQRDVQPGSLLCEERNVSKLLYGRLDPRVVAEIEQRLKAHPELDLPASDSSDPTRRLGLLLTYGMWLEIAGVSEQTGLTTAQPPEEVHAMTRGPLAAAGGLYEADMVVDALRSAQAGIEEVGAALDFGCSSGRVVRVLATAYPQVRWLGCDPNGPAIEWARQNLPAIEFFTSPQQPPLDLHAASLDLVYAISVWSHFGPELGLKWFAEMHRVLRSGGYLVFTTHGLQSVAFFSAEGWRPPRQTAEIAQALYARGWWYAAEFGERGDWGVVNPEWGTAFLSPEWLLAELCPGWRVIEFAPGRNQANQDVYVLERV
jgi:SAM-dependent methyltransferase